MHSVTLLIGIAITTLLATVDRVEGGIPIIYSNNEHVIKVVEFPDIAELKNEKGYVDAGYRFTTFALFFIPIWNYDGQWCFYIDGDTYVPSTRSDLEIIANACNVQLGSSSPSLPFWYSYGGKLIFFLAGIFFVIYKSEQSGSGKSEQSESGEIPELISESPNKVSYPMPNSSQPVSTALQPIHPPLPVWRSPSSQPVSTAFQPIPKRKFEAGSGDNIHSILPGKTHPQPVTVARRIYLGKTVLPQPAPTEEPPTPIYDKWYIYLEFEVIGPYTIEQLHGFQRDGTTNDATQCCKEGTEDWQPISTLIQ